MFIQSRTGIKIIQLQTLSSMGLIISHPQESGWSLGTRLAITEGREWVEPGNKARGKRVGGAWEQG